MKNALLILLNLGFIFGSSCVQAQCRPATAAENQAYERVVKELQRQFAAKLPSNDWRVFDEKHSVGSLEVTDEYITPLHLCTDRYDLVAEKNDVAVARQTKLDALKPDTTQQTSFVIPRDSIYQENASAATPSKQTYSISVEMNLANYRLQEAESARLVESSKNIMLTGAPVALEVLLKPDLKGVVGRQETVILLGNWGKPQTEKNGDIRYRHNFKKGGKLVESLVVTITAPFELARQITQTTDWKALVASLLQ